MKITVEQKGSSRIAIISGDGIIISDAQSALDLMATVRHEYDCDKIIIRKSNITEDFFDLKNGLAGEILQKYTNYRMKIAITGDFSVYDSKSLKDFIYECNKGNEILFLPDENDAIVRLHDISA